MPLQPIPLPPIAVLRALFRYDARTGALFNRISRTSRKIGERADRTIIRGGYRRVYVDGRLRCAHRVVWAIAHGREPEGFIDHIDGDGANNRITNLRVATHLMNMCNRPAPPHNTSGAKGISFRKDNGKWRASLTVNKRRISLGQFDELAEAVRVMKRERRKHHGVFAKD